MNEADGSIMTFGVGPIVHFIIHMQLLEHENIWPSQDNNRENEGTVVFSL